MERKHTVLWVTWYISHFEGLGYYILIKNVTGVVQGDKSLSALLGTSF